MISVKLFPISIGIVAIVQLCAASNWKQLKRCELANTLLSIQPDINNSDLNKWVCIAEQANFDSSSILQSDNGEQFYGLFGLSDRSACAKHHKFLSKRTCRVLCNKFNDNKVNDDFSCAQKVFAVEAQNSGDGFSAFGKAHCDHINLIRDCHVDALPIDDLMAADQTVLRRIPRRARKSHARNYTRCELIQEFESSHDMPPERGAIWTCLAINEPNARKSRPAIENPLDRNRIRLRDIYPCKSAQIIAPCFTTCHELRKFNDIEFVDCMRKIYDDERSRSGNGFYSWAAYNSSCLGKSQEYGKGCGDEPVTGGSKPTPSSDENKKPIGNKIYEPCELATELRDIYNFPLEELGIWVCISERSEYNTTLLTTADEKGNRDHGILRINDAWWCGQNGVGGICNIECSKFRDSNIGDDFACGRLIFRETMAKSGDGFTGKKNYSTKKRL